MIGFRLIDCVVGCLFDRLVEDWLVGIIAILGTWLIV